ncbi:MAG TPA: SDR family NAD(P)-dependent oxidoreductase [Pirellulales bacterium]|jgi:short-subunit dehydrogenase|nr:SDR family NAD(P)-dependent oxidoreductase [Pirellulales bacterium]
MPAALVTGGGTGIGRQIALALARRGYDVAVAGRRAEPLAAVVEHLASMGVRGVPIQADLASAAEREALCAKVRAELGTLEVLVHNAAVLAAGAIESPTSDELERTIVTNLTAPIDMTRRLVADLEQRRGVVVLVASGAANLPFPYLSLYCGTKAALAMWGEALRPELRSRGVRLLTAYPPFTATAMTCGLAEAAQAPWLRAASPERVGEQIVRALALGRQRYYCAWSDWALAHAARLMPGVVRWVLAGQRKRFQRMAEGGRRKG